MDWKQSLAQRQLHQINTQIYYLRSDPKWETEKPYYSNIPFEHPESKQSNLDTAPVDVVVTDIRGFEEEFKLETHGFQVLRTTVDAKAVYNNLGDPFWVQDEYYPQVEQWLKDAIGEEKVERIYIYDHTVRRRDPNAPIESRGTEGALQPVPAAHTDHTLNSGSTRAKLHFSEHEASSLMRNRFQIVNIWHPLFGPLEDWPLALCEPSSVSHKDMIPTDLIYPHYLGEIYSLSANPNHCWFYISEQTPNEPIAFKNFDSDVTSQTRFTPHCGIKNPETPNGARSRESIEFRVMVFYKDCHY